MTTRERKTVAEGLVSNGMDYLDRLYGPNWVYAIDLDRFGMSQGVFTKEGEKCGCVLAQLDGFFKNTTGLTDRTGFYIAFALQWNLTVKELREFGFSNHLVNYGSLTRAWRIAITKRMEVSS